MPTFQYTARNTDNEPVSGELEADSRSAARTELEGRGWHSIEVTSAASPEPESSQETPQTESAPAEVLFEEEVGIPLEQMTGAGLPLESGLRILAESHPSPRVSRDLSQLSNRLAKGESWEQISEGSHPTLPPVYRELLQLKLPPGQMSDLLGRYGHHTREAAETRKRIWAGLFYSFVILFALSATMVFFLWYLVPQFKKIFEGFATELPNATQFFIDLSDFFIAVGWWIPIVLLALVVIPWLVGGDTVRRFMQRLWYKFPFSGRAFEGASLSAFCRLLAELVQRHVPLGVSLKIAARGSRDLALQKDCETIARQLEEGVPLGEAFLHAGTFPPELMHAFRWSTRQSEFVESLYAGGHAFQGQARTRAGLIPLISEPFLLFVVLLMVIALTSAMFLPLIKLLNDLS